MRKNATKIAAMMLSLALTVTSVNIPTTSSAATKVKLNKTKATLYVGGASSKKTTTLKATFNGKKVKATFTSSNAKVAKVAKTTGKVTAVKAGSATITAKYKGKKATAKITVKQYVTGVTANPTTVELKEGEFIDLSKNITVKPANASNKALSYKSGDSLIAAVNAKGTLLKGVKEGTTTITVKAKDGSNKKATVAVNVTKADATETPAPSDEPTETPTPSTKEAKDVKVSVENPFSADYANTLLVGTNAEVKVQVTDEDGNPVANQDVELTVKKVYPSDTSNNDYVGMFSNLTDNVKTTDANGCITFVYGLNKNNDKDGKAIDATRQEFVSSFKLTASVVGKSSIQASTDVKFAAVTASAATNISVKNGTTGYAALVKGVNAANATASTVDRNENNVTYVTSQQVSAAGTDAHAVTFASGVSALRLITPGTETTGTDAADIKETIDFSTEKYSTYTTTTQWAKVIDTVDASQLQYATVNFGKLSLSKYSRFIVRAYLVTNKSNPTATTGNTITSIPLSDAGAYVVGEKVDSNFSVQIPVNATSGYLYVTAQVESKGQVNTDVNEGFTVKNVVGVQKKGTTSVSGIGGVDIPGLTVEWAKDTEATYTLNKELPTDSAISTALAAQYPNCTFQYKVPAFPRTGNGIITVYDNTNKAIAYYAIPTVNAQDEKGNYLNQNVLSTSVADMYQLSQEEALNEVGTVETVNGDAKVNSEKSGVTHIVGTITSTNDNIKIDATNKLIYTSVHWNPIPNAGQTAATTAGQAAAALVGQQITLKAQLTDANGNAVSTKGIPVKFYNDDTDHQITAANSTVDEASLIKVDETTDALGQAELTLVSGKPAEALKIFAAVDNKQFNVSYVVGTETVTKDWVDLYWVDANLYFEPDANTLQIAKTTFDAPVVDTKNVFDVVPTVGSNWAYEVRTNGDLLGKTLSGTLAGYNTVEINGLSIQTTVGTDSVGTVTNNSNGKANATSTKAGYTKLVNVLDNSSVGKDVTFTFSGAAGKAAVTVINAGTGAPTLDKKLTLSINWTAGVPTANIIIPTSLKADVTSTKVPVYVEVKDANGNPLKDKTATLKVTGAGAVTTPTATTDENGIAAFEVTPDGAAAGTTSSIVATVDGLTGTYASSIKWVDVSKLDALKITKVAYDYTAKTIKLTFNNDIYADSVIAEQFTVTYAGVKQLVTGVAVAGNTVTLNVPALTTVNGDDDFVVTIASATKTDIKSIEYGFVSVDGQSLVTPNDTVTFTADGTIK